MTTPTVPEEATEMAYADPEGRPRPMVEAVSQMIASARLSDDDKAAIRAALDASDPAAHAPWCSRHMSNGCHSEVTHWAGETVHGEAGLSLRYGSEGPAIWITMTWGGRFADPLQLSLEQAEVLVNVVRSAPTEIGDAVEGLFVAATRVLGEGATR